MTQSPTRETRVSDLRPVPDGKVDPSLPDPGKHAVVQDPLEELLGAPKFDPSKITAPVDMKPLFQAPWTVRALDDDLNDRLVAESTTVLENPRNKQQSRQFDPVEYSKLVIYWCVVNPDLRDPKLAQKYGIGRTQHTRLVKEILKLPGYTERLASKIMELSGFSEQYIEVAKNSLREEG